MLASVALLVAAAAAAVAQGAPDYAAIVASPDRSDADREIDKRRDPAKLLAFTGVRSGMKVLDMGAGGGYSTELMARAVGAGGVVYAQNAVDLGAREGALRGAHENAGDDQGRRAGAAVRRPAARPRA
jgi:predicted methyltransferase